MIEACVQKGCKFRWLPAIALCNALLFLAADAGAQDWWGGHRNDNASSLSEAAALPQKTGPTVIECLDVPKKKGYPKQRLFVAFVNGKPSSEKLPLLNFKWVGSAVF